MNVEKALRVLVIFNKCLVFLIQAVTQQLDQAQQSLSNVANDEEKAKAQIAVECLDALNKALGH